MKKYLPLYYEWIEAGSIPGWGLCGSLGKDDNILDFQPDGDKRGSYWGHELGDTYEKLCYPHDMAKRIHYEFTPLRQNIVLLMACLNNEL